MNLGNSISKMFKRIFTKPTKKEIIKVDARINANMDKRISRGNNATNPRLRHKRKFAYKTLEKMHFGTFSPVGKF